MVGNSLEVQWLGLHVLTAEVSGSIPGQGTKIPQAAWHGQKTQKGFCIWISNYKICNKIYLYIHKINYTHIKI